LTSVEAQHTIVSPWMGPSTTAGMRPGWTAAALLAPTASGCEQRQQRQQLMLWRAARLARNVHCLPSSCPAMLCMLRLRLLQPATAAATLRPFAAKCSRLQPNAAEQHTCGCKRTQMPTHTDPQAVSLYHTVHQESKLPFPAATSPTGSACPLPPHLPHPSRPHSAHLHQCPLRHLTPLPAAARRWSITTDSVEAPAAAAAACWTLC
jgi:hypothetical protein